MKIMALIVAAGTGMRCNTSIPKQYCNIGTVSILEKTIQAFISHTRVTKVQAVINHEHKHLYKVPPHQKLLPPVTGGNRRQDSVFNGLKALQEHNPDFVLIHDCARPFTSQQLITRVIQSLKVKHAVLPTLTVNDALLEVNAKGTVTNYLNRNNCRRTQTPQGFDFQTIMECHHRETNSENTFDDDGSLANKHAIPIMTVMGEHKNIKITFKEDLSA